MSTTPTVRTHPQVRSRARSRRLLVTTIVGLVALAAPFGAGACGPTATSSDAPSGSQADQTGSTSAPSTNDDDVVHVAVPTHAGVEVHAAPDAASPVTSVVHRPMFHSSVIKPFGKQHPAQQQEDHPAYRQAFE